MAKKAYLPTSVLIAILGLVIGFMFLDHQSASADYSITGLNSSALGSTTGTSNPTIYVDVDAVGSGTGDSWENAYTTLQDALTAAISGHEIWVAEGVYYPDEGSGQTNNARSSTFSLKQGVTIYGGFAATETVSTERDWTTHITVLSGDIDGNDTTDAYGVVTATTAITGSNAYNVVKSYNMDATAVLDGFTITAGNANGSSCPGSMCGAGILNYSSGSGSNPTLNHLVFSANNTSYYGGGIANYNSASPTLTDVTFTSNTSTYDGAGMASEYNCSPVLNDVTFISNSATVRGGGIYNSGGGTHSLTNVSFISNTAGNGGGYYANAAYETTAGDLTLSTVSFTGNTATATTSYGGDQAYCNGGAGLCHINGGTVTITNVTFENNTSSLNAGGMYLSDEGYTATLENISFTGNSCKNGGCGLYIGDGSVNAQQLTFTNNQADASVGDGAGLEIYSGTVVMTDTTFTGNSGRLGGAMIVGGGSTTMTDFTFENNSSNNTGGGFYAGWDTNVSLSHGTFIGNSAPYGGGLTNSIYNVMQLNDVTFTRNNATSEGGAINNQGPMAVTDCYFYGNSASRGAGFRNYYVSFATITNSLFVGNSAFEYGGGIYSEISDSSLFTVTNSTLSNNTATYGKGVFNYSGEKSALINSVLWGDASYQIFYSSDDIIVSYSDVQGGYSGSNNLDSDPLFVSTPSAGDDSTWGTSDDDYGDLRLTHTSPVIDAGNDAEVFISTDLAGNPRSMGDAVDMGAYEVEITNLTEPNAETWYDLSPEVCGRVWFTNTGVLPSQLFFTMTHEAPSLGGGLQRRYEISANDGSEYEAAIELCYEDEELTLAGIESGQEGNLHAYRYAGSGTWEEYSVVDTTNNTITANNVGAFGIWGFGTTGNQPTVIQLNSLAGQSEGGWQWVVMGMLVMTMMAGWGAYSKSRK